MKNKRLTLFLKVAEHCVLYVLIFHICGSAIIYAKYQELDFALFLIVTICLIVVSLIIAVIVTSRILRRKDQEKDN